MQSQISFDLKNLADVAVIAVLIPAMLRRNVKLKDRFLEGESFNDETGDHSISVANVEPANAIDELNEFTSQLAHIKVLGAIVGTANLEQGTLNFIDKQHIEFKPSVDTNIDAIATLSAGTSGVRHDFMQPWVSGPMKTLAMKLLPSQTVRVTLLLDFPDFADTEAVKAAIFPQQ
jgi:hypothetical protein